MSRDPFSAIVRRILNDQPVTYPTPKQLVAKNIRLLRDERTNPVAAELMNVLDGRLQSEQKFIQSTLQQLTKFKRESQAQRRRIVDEIKKQREDLLRVRNKYALKMQKHITDNANKKLLEEVDLYWKNISNGVQDRFRTDSKDPYTRLRYLQEKGVDVDPEKLTKASEASQHLQELRNQKSNMEYSIRDVIDPKLKALEASEASRLRTATQQIREAALRTFEQSHSQYSTDTQLLRNQQESLFKLMRQQQLQLGQILEYYKQKMRMVEQEAFQNLSKLHPPQEALPNTSESSSSSSAAPTIS